MIVKKQIHVKPPTEELKPRAEATQSALGADGRDNSRPVVWRRRPGRQAVGGVKVGVEAWTPIVEQCPLQTRRSVAEHSWKFWAVVLPADVNAEY